MNSLPFLNPAGGLRYHLRAFRYQKTLWLPFRKAIRDWIRSLDFNPLELHAKGQASTLVIFGSSGGYCLPLEWVARYSRVVCYEPDPAAQYILRKRLEKTAKKQGLKTPELSQRTTDLFIKPGLPGLAQTADPWLSAIHEFPHAHYIFSNFLGQIRFLLPPVASHLEDAREKSFLDFWYSRLESDLKGKSYISFHDRFSSKNNLDFQQPFTSPDRLSTDEIWQLLYPKDAEFELIDHCTSTNTSNGAEGFFKQQRPHTYFHWKISPGWTHLIEGVSTKGI